jgi:integrase
MASVRKRNWITAAGEPRSAWVADYFDQNRKRHEKAFPTQKAAKAWLIEAQGEVARGVHTPERHSITVAEAAQVWLERGRAERLERSTLRGYTASVRLYIASDDSGIGAVKLAQLSTPMLENWRDRLLIKMSRRTARKVLGALKAILAEAQRRGFVAQNAALPVKIDARKRDVRKLEIGLDIPGKPDIQSLLAACTGIFARRRPFIVTAIFTGMRASELRGLPWSAVDFDKKTITVRQRADEWGTMAMPKSHAGQREIPMAGHLLNTLREWKLACPKGDLDLVFPNGNGNVERFSNLTRRVWYPLQQAAGLVDENGKPLFDFHTLRHYAASVWIAAGFSPKRLQALLGHSSIQMTFDRYGHLFPSVEDDHAKFARIEHEIGLVA